MGTTTNSGPPAGTPAGPPVHQRDSSGAPAGFVRLADLYHQLGGHPRTVRDWVAANVPPDHQIRVPRPTGGSPELWIAEPDAERLRAELAPAGSAGDEQRATSGEIPGAPAGVPADGWREALEESRARNAELAAERDRLRAQLETVREEARAVRQQAEEAERGRHAGETRLEALRAAWWRWQHQLSQLGTWGRLRRRWPEQPAELTADRLLEDQKGRRDGVQP